MKRIFIPIIAALAFCAASCTKKASPERVNRLDLEIRDLATADSMAISDSCMDGASLMFRAMGYDSVSPELLQWWSNSDAVRIFQPDVDSVYTSLSDLEAELGVIMQRARRDSLPLPQMRFYSVVWGRPQPLLRDSDVMLIALNHYLGADYEGYSHWESYRRAPKTPEMLPYDIAATLAATSCPMTDPDQATLLDWMLYEGALVEARMRLVPDAKLATALGYDESMLKGLDQNYDQMMEELATRRLMHDTDPVLIDRMIAPGPHSPLLNGWAPGRVGRYIGYRLVEDYLRTHSKATLPELLALKGSDLGK